MISTPTISVMMPVFIAAEFLDEAISSILGQTFRDFEFIIIDDGSRDDSAYILEKYTRADSRLRVFRQANEGMISALNQGCRLAHGSILPGWMPEYIEKHPQIGILGTWLHGMDESGSAKWTWRPPTNPKVLKWTHFFGVCVPHPTVLMRRDVVGTINVRCSGDTLFTRYFWSGR